MEELIARLEKASGPDRGLDADIWLSVDRSRALGACGAGWRLQYASDPIPAALMHIPRANAPAYTASLDAAMTLRDRDNWPICVVQDMGPVMGWSARLAIIDTSGDEPKPIMRDGHAQTAAVALCIAALRALNSEPSR